MAFGDYKNEFSYIRGFISAGLDTHPQTGESREVFNPYNRRTNPKDHFLFDQATRDFYQLRTQFNLSEKKEFLAPSAVSRQHPEQKRRQRKSLAFWIDSNRKNPVGVNS